MNHLLYLGTGLTLLVACALAMLAVFIVAAFILDLLLKVERKFSLSIPQIVGRIGKPLVKLLMWLFLGWLLFGILHEVGKDFWT